MEQRVTRAQRSQKHTKHPKMNRPKSNDGEKKRKKSYIASNLAKVLLVLILMAVFFVVGTMIGYGVLGGGNSFDVFKSTTWEHLFSFF